MANYWSAPGRSLIELTAVSMGVAVVEKVGGPGSTALLKPMPFHMLCKIPSHQIFVLSGNLFDIRRLFKFRWLVFIGACAQHTHTATLQNIALWNSNTTEQDIHLYLSTWNTDYKTTQKNQTIFHIYTTRSREGMSGADWPPGCLTLARWAGWSAGQVGHHVKCWRRERNGGGGQRPLAIGREGPEFLVTPLLMGAGLPN